MGGDTNITGVSVVGMSLGTADALATAIYADQALSFEWMDAFPGYGVVLFTADAEVRWSPTLAGTIEVAAPPEG